MLFGNRPLYEQARAAKRGKRKLPQPLEELRHWVSENYGINVLTVFYDKIDLGPHEGEPRLTFVVDTAKDYAKIHIDRLTIKPHIKECVLEKFSEITAAAALDNEYVTKNVLLLFDDFSNEAMGQAAERFRERYKKRLIKEFAPFHVWAIDGFSNLVVVFYLTDKDVQDNQANGSSEKIKQRCYELAKRYDEFDYFDQETFPIRFDSKENLNKKFAGNLFYYFR
jgi:hypothetical protein